MDHGIPAALHPHESRFAATLQAVAVLVAAGHDFLIEQCNAIVSVPDRNDAVVGLL